MLFSFRIWFLSHSQMFMQHTTGLALKIILQSGGGGGGGGILCNLKQKIHSQYTCDG